MTKARLFTPSAVLAPPAGEQINFNDFKYRLLAQGDSWFSIGTANLIQNSNLISGLDFPNSRCIINCGRPGTTLRRMVDQMSEPNFRNLLCGNQRLPWHGILLSAGGNDMIEALGHKDIADPALRLFLNPAEITGDITICDSYLSPAGWATFETHIRAIFQVLIDLRDSTSTNKDIPIFLHTYHFPTIRDAGVGFNFGPWLFKAVKSFKIPEPIWPSLGRKLFNQFGTLLNDVALLHNNVHVFDSANLVTTITPALPRTQGQSGDWINEIHLSKAGYEKISLEWSKDIEFILP
jgi:hypothetical protein